MPCMKTEFLSVLIMGLDKVGKILFLRAKNFPITSPALGLGRGVFVLVYFRYTYRYLMVIMDLIEDNKKKKKL